MTKFAKMSLIAAIAIAGTTASAQPLAEAIKNVDVSGTAAYRYNDYEANGDATNNYKVAVNLKSKVNDDLTFNTRTILGEATNPKGFGTSTADAEIAFALSEVNFVYTGLMNTSVAFGKQAVSGPFTITRDAMGNEQTGTGIFVTSSFKPVNLYVGYFNQTNFNTGDFGTGVSATGGEDVIIAGLSASFGPINIDGSYMDVEDAFDAYTIGLDASFNLASVELSSFARYSSLDLDNSSQDNELWKVGVAAQMGIFGAHLSYGETDEEGGTVGIDASSTTGFDEHWRVTLSTVNDASVVYAGIDAQVTEKIKLALNYSDLDAGSSSTDVDQSEVYGQVSYQMSNNLSTFIRFGQLDKDGQEKATMGRAHIQYNF